VNNNKQGCRSRTAEARGVAGSFGASPTHVGGTPFMNALLVTQSMLPLLELRYVDLAPGEALL
jgi:hypothetical protein